LLFEGDCKLRVEHRRLPRPHLERLLLENVEAGSNDFEVVLTGREASELVDAGGVCLRAYDGAVTVASITRLSS
jgi:hypothetical protein